MLIHGVASLSDEQAGCRLAACWERVWFVLRLQMSIRNQVMHGRLNTKPNQLNLGPISEHHFKHTPSYTPKEKSQLCIQVHAHQPNYTTNYLIALGL